MIALAENIRQKITDGTNHAAADGGADPQGQGNALGCVMHGAQRAGQEDRGQRTNHGQSDAGQNVMEMNVEVPVGKGDLVSLEQAAHFSSSHCGDGDGDDVHRAPLTKNDLDSEHHS